MRTKSPAASLSLFKGLRRRLKKRVRPTRDNQTPAGGTPRPLTPEKTHAAG